MTHPLLNHFLFFSFAFWPLGILSIWWDNQHATWLLDKRYLKQDTGRSATTILRQFNLLRWSDHSKAIWVSLTSTILFVLNEQILGGWNKRCYLFLLWRRWYHMYLWRAKNPIVHSNWGASQNSYCVDKYQFYM